MGIAMGKRARTSAHAMSTADLTTAIRQLNEQDWSKQELCFSCLLMLLHNIVASPTEPKFRQLKLSNAELRGKMGDVPGALDFLRAAGFVEQEDCMVLPAGVVIQDALAFLKKEADEAHTNELRRQRDEDQDAKQTDDAVPEDAQ